MQLKRPDPYNTIIIEPNGDRRGRLKLVIHHDQNLGISTFGKVHTYANFNEAYCRLEEDLDYDVLLVSDSFSMEQTQAFIEKISQLSEEKFGLVVVYRMNNQENVDVADKLVSGVDGFLYEPYSVETLREVTEIAERVRMENVERRIHSAANLVLSSALNEIDDAAYRILEERALKPFSRKVVSALTMFATLPEPLKQVYFDVLDSHCEQRPPIPDRLIQARRELMNVPEYGGASEKLRRRLEDKKQKLRNMLESERDKAGLSSLDEEEPKSNKRAKKV